MWPKSTKDLWFILINRIRVFNLRTGDSVPDIYYPKYSTDKRSLYRFRNDLDNLVKNNNVINTSVSPRYYLATRSIVEIIADQVDLKSVHH